MFVHRTRLGFPALGLALILLTGMAGCGKKGPLYLPKEGAPAPASVPADETREKDKSKP